MSTTVPLTTPSTPTVLGEIADFAVAAFESNSAAIEAAISSGEISLPTEVSKLLAFIPKPGGAAGMFAAPIESAIESALVAGVSAAVTKYNSAVLFALVDKLFHTWAADLGG